MKDIFKAVKSSMCPPNFTIYRVIQGSATISVMNKNIKADQWKYLQIYSLIFSPILLFYLSTAVKQ
jgi:hypothetical protein